MKKVIFLLVFFVSSVFGGSHSSVRLIISYIDNDFVYCSQPGNFINSPLAIEISPFLFNCNNPDSPFVFPENISFQTCKITETILNGRIDGIIENGDNDICGWDYDKEILYEASWQCIQPSGGCPVGQTFDEQTCTCKCNPLPNYPILLSPPVTQHSDCILTNPDIVVSDGLLGYIGDVSWSSCESKCYGSTTPCPPHTAIVNGSCQIPSSPPCSGSTSTSFGASDGPSGKMCYIHFYCNGTEVGRQQVSCDTSTPDSNSTGGGGDNGGGDSNSTGGGSGTTTTTTGGDGGGSTSGDSNSTGTGTGTGDSNSTGGSGGGGGGSGDSNTTGNLDFLSDAISDILNRYQIDYTKPCSSLQPISFNLYGKHITILSQSMIDLLPMSAIKAFVIFSFTLIGVLFAFKGGD